MDPAQYQNLLQGLEQATANELVQPVLEEKEDDFGTLAQENLEGMGTFLLGHSGSQILGGVNKALGITKKAGLSEEAQKEFADAIKEGDFGKVFQKITKFGLKRVGTTLQEKGEDIIKQVRGTAQEVETPPVEGEEEESPDIEPEGADTEDAPDPVQDNIDDLINQIQGQQQELEGLQPTIEQQATQEAEDTAKAQKVIDESQARTQAANEAADDLDDQISQAADLLQTNIGRVSGQLAITADDMTAEAGTKAYLEPKLAELSKVGFNRFRSRFREARLKPGDIEDEALRRRLNSRIGSNIIDDLKQRKEGTPDLNPEGKEPPQIYDGNQARENISLSERNQLQEESRGRTSKINQDLDKQDQDLSDLTDQLSKNQGDVEAALKKLSTQDLSDPTILEATGPTVGEEATGTLGRLTELGEGGGRISNAFDLVRNPTILRPSSSLEDLVSSAGLENNSGSMGSLLRTNPLFNAAVDNEADTAARNLALSARNALSSSITARPNIPDLPSAPSAPTAEEAGQAAREALGNLASQSEKIASDASEAAQKALSGLTKSEDVVKALKTATATSAEEDFDPVNIALTGALGLASVLGGLFVKTKSDEDISRDLNPVNFGVQIGGS